MRCRTVAGGLFLLLTAAPVAAGDLDWLKSDQEKSALSQMAAAFAAAGFCDRLVNASVAGRWIDETFGGRQFTAEEAAKIVKVVIGIQAIQAQMGVIRDPTYCETARGYFGPGGKKVPGFFD